MNQINPYNLTNYREKCFDYKTLTKAHGEPNIDSIVLLYDQVKINFKKVRTTLGGGQFCYLAVAISTPVYEIIPSTVPFVRPTHPGPFTPVAPAAAAPTVATRLICARIASKLMLPQNYQLKFLWV